MKPNPPLFTAEEFNDCSWKPNCGPGALAAVLNLTLDDVRPHMGDFEKKHYTNIRLMQHALNSLKILHQLITQTQYKRKLYPSLNLLRIQWEGPWTEPSAYPTTKLRHSHWIGSYCEKEEEWIFDINCLSVGGWVSKDEWSNQVVPWLLPQVEPKANGLWYPTHILELFI